MSEEIEKNEVVAQDISDILVTGIDVAQLLLPKARTELMLGRIVASRAPKLYAQVAKLIAGEAVDELELNTFHQQLDDLAHPERFYKTP